MKILHTSDWHLGASDGDRSLLEDQKCFIDEICGVIETEQIDAVIIAGDVYDRSVASAEAIKLYDYAVNRICLELGKDAIVVAGNHDGAERLAGYRGFLEKSGLYVLGAISREPFVISYDDTQIYMFPWFTEEKVKGLFPENPGSINNLTEAYRVVCKHATESFDDKKKHIAVAHAFITNSQVSGSDRAAEIASIGTASQVDADVFEDFDYVALGHIHGPQNVTDKIRYCGTPMAFSFGREEKQEKSVTVIDTEDMSQTIIPLHPLHRRTTLEGNFDELLAANYDTDVINGYVRLVVNDIHVGLESIARLREVYPQLLEIKGKTFESDNASIRMTMEEFQGIENNPAAIFKSFCMDTMNEEPGEHLLELFSECIAEE